MNIRTLLTLFASFLLVASASAQVTIDGTFFTSSVVKTSGDTVLTFSPTGFSATASDKLVIGFGGRPVNSTYTSVPSLVSATYGGQNLNVGVSRASGQCVAYVFYLDNVASDGDIVFTFDGGWGDSLGINVFALSGTADGDPTATDTVNVAGAGMSLAAPGSGGFMLYQTGLRGGSTAVTSVTGATNNGVTTLTNSRGTAAYWNGTTSGATYSGSTGGTNGYDVASMAFFPTTSTQVTVPDVVGLAQTAAESAITGASLTVGAETTDYSASVPSGDVISQDPAAGVEVVTGSSVDLVISLGPPPPVNVPDVVGLDQATAESTITGASLAVGTVTYQNDAVVAAGNVISQDPTAGSTVDTGSSVDLVVSLGPQPTVPDVVDLDQATAESTLTGASLTVGMVSNGYSPTIAVGNVVSQYPAAGASVDTGSSVKLVISLGPNPAPGTIAGIFTFRNDFVGSLDSGGSETISMERHRRSPFLRSAFTAAGTDKLVAVISLHNSSATTAPVTGVTYGGASLNLVVGNEGAGYSKNTIYYLDNVTTDGDLVIDFDDSTENIDEVGVQLFALNGLPSGTAYAAESLGTGSFTPINAAAGDFVVGVAQRNNQPGTITVSNSPPYSAINLTTGNLTSVLGYQVASLAGATAPSFTGTLSYESVAAFGTGGLSSGFDSWSGGEPFDGDANADGVSNGVAWLLGAASPSEDATGRLPTVAESGGGLVLTFNCLPTADRGAAVLSVQHSSDLGVTDPWIGAEVPDADDGPTNGVSFVVDTVSEAPLNKVTATIGLGEAAGGKLFGRLHADQP